jgi:competence protein ComEC
MRRKLLISLAIVLMIEVVGVLTTFTPADGLLHIYFLDIGQGDATLIKSPDDYYMLIDTGREASLFTELDRLLPWGRGLDLLLITHPDADHTAFLEQVTIGYQPDLILLAHNPKYDSFLKDPDDLQALNIDSHTDFKIGCCSEFNVLWPRSTETLFEIEESNDQSIAAVLTFHDFQLYTAGDLGNGFEEQSLIDYVNPAEIDALKVGHHGSKTSSPLEFLNQVTPSWSFISVGAGNTYGHPNPTILENLAVVGSEVYRTDQLGTIELITDGQTFVQVKSHKTLEHWEFKL